MGAYEDAEEQGLLLRLPFKVGNTVYYISEGFIEPCTVEAISLADYTDKMETVPIWQKFIMTEKIVLMYRLKSILRILEKPYSLHNPKQNKKLNELAN